MAASAADRLAERLARLKKTLALEKTARTPVVREEPCAVARPRGR